eukprot:Nitzschia sp. Nitz4//scaffold175_size95217//71243//72771//NITZ4_004732-RA/size95217-augustus-gene-0.26-mRNA-1//-1//CDS//3329538966//3210//frame0
MAPTPTMKGSNPTTANMSVLLEAAIQRAVNPSRGNEKMTNDSASGSVRNQTASSDSAGLPTMSSNSLMQRNNLFLPPPPPANAPPAAATTEALLEKQRAELLRQFVQQPAPAAPAAGDANALLQTLSSLFNPAPDAAAAAAAQQSNQVLVALDLLRVLGINQQPQPPMPQTISVPSSSVPDSTGIGSAWTSSTLESQAGSADGKNIPGRTRISCRARGMPPDHCSESAYFWIHPDMPHGADLLCSYPSCREGGVKFRYCKFCKVPAAKRSFLFRHGHTKKNRPAAESPQASSDVEVSDSESPEGDNRLKSSSEGERQEYPRLQDQGEEQQDAAGKASSPAMVSDEGESKHQAKKPRTDAGNSDGGQAVSDDPRMVAWLKLLHERPEEGNEDKMSMWLMKILKVSDTRGSHQGEATQPGTN